MSPGRIDNIAEAMRIEVAQARWVRLEDAPKLLAYRGEKQMARKALEYVEAHAGLVIKESKRGVNAVLEPLNSAEVLENAGLSWTSAW